MSKEIGSDSLMKKLAILTAFALALGACGGQLQKVMLGPNASSDARECAALGFVPGTDEFSNCEGVMSRRLAPDEY